MDYNLIFSTVPARTNCNWFQSVYKERTAIPYVDHNVVVTTVMIAMKTNFSGNHSFVNCWVCSVHPPRQVGRQWVGILVPTPAENLYQSSVKFLSLLRSPRPKSLCRSESFRNLYCLHSEVAKNENVLEYSSIWLSEKRNVLISNKRGRKRGHGNQNILGGWG